MTAGLHPDVELRETHASPAIDFRDCLHYLEGGGGPAEEPVSPLQARRGTKAEAEGHQERPEMPPCRQHGNSQSLPDRQHMPGTR